MSNDRDSPLSVRWQEIINTANDDRQPTEQAAFAFFAALLHVVEERHGISLTPATKEDSPGVRGRCKYDASCRAGESFVCS